MIDLTQWRVCIGMWCCRLKPFKRKSSCHNEQSRLKWTDDCLSETNTLQLCMCILRALLSHTRVLLYTLTVCIFLQLMVSGDVEKNPGPVDFTPGKAVAVLRECGFNFKSKWSSLTSILNVPQEKREKMRTIIEEDEAYEHALEIALDWWIKNTSEASWKELISVVYRCGENDTVDAMRKQLDLIDDQPLKDQLIKYVGQCSSSIKLPPIGQSSTVMYRTHIVSDPHEIRLYRNYQRARYQRTEFPTYFKGPNPSIGKLINLELVNKKRESREERFEGMTDKLHGNVSRYVQQRRPLGIEQIAEVKECEKLPRNILIEGDPGVGKTTLVWELCKGWGENRLLQQWDVVVLVQLCDIDAREASSLEQLLDPDEQFRSELDYIKKTRGNGVMIIFDGYDELSEKQKQRTSVLKKLLTRRLLPGATLLVTSRPVATRELPTEFREQLHEHIEVVGFSDNDIDKYIECKFCDTPDILKDFQSYISSHPFIHKAMYIPLHCALVTDLYHTYWRKGKKAFAPKTITQLYTCFLHSLLERCLDGHPVYGPQELCVQELTDLPQDVYYDLMRLAELAAIGIRKQEYVFDNLTLNTLGLMQRVNDSESRKSKSVSYSFLHLTLQEYLAALYLSKLSSEKVSHLFTESGALPLEKFIHGEFWVEAQDDFNVHWAVLHFYGGLTGIVGTPLESIFVDIKFDSMNHNVLYLLLESQNIEYISTVLKENQYCVEIKSKLQGYITAYCIFHCSPTAKWDIHDEKNYLLQLMIRDTSSMGGMISSLDISNITDYSKLFQILFQLEQYTSEISSLFLDSSDNDCTCCDELSQLYRYCSKLQTCKLSVKGSKLNCIPFFSSLHLMTCLETLDLQGIIIDDSNHIVSNGLRQTTTLKSLSLRDCDLMNLSPEGLSQNKSLISLNLENINTNVEGSKAMKQILKKNVNLKSLALSGSFKCPPSEEHSISHIMRKEVFEGIQQNKSLKELSLHNFRLLGLEVISTNSTLTTLDLNHLNMDKEGALALKQVLIENSTLRELILDDCIKSMDVAEVVAEGLKYNMGVMKLLLQSIIEDGVIRTLIQGLSYNRSLQFLILINNDMNIEDFHVLSDLLKLNSRMKHLTIFEYINAEKAKCLANSLALSKLEEIHIFDFSSMGHNGAKVLADVVKTNLSIKLILPDKYQQDLSVYSYPVDRVIYEIEKEGAYDVDYGEQKYSSQDTILFHKEGKDIIDENLCSVLCDKAVQFDHNVPMEDLLHGACVAEENVFHVVGDREQLFIWSNCGFRLYVPKGALLPTETCTVAVKALIAGRFVLPKSTELVSALYAISSSQMFRAEIKIEIEHCVLLKNNAQCAYLQFVKAHQTQPGKWYHFSLQGGEFCVESNYGGLWQSEFSIVGIVDVNSDDDSDNDTSDTENNEGGDDNGEGGSSNSHNEVESDDDDDDQHLYQEQTSHSEDEVKSKISNGSSFSTAEPHNTLHSALSSSSQQSEDTTNSSKQRLNISLLPKTMSDSKEEELLDYSKVKRDKMYRACTFYEKDSMKRSSWDFILVAVKHLSLHVKVVCDRMSKCEEAAGFAFRFLEIGFNQYIGLKLQVEDVKGWKLKPNIKPCQVTKDDIDFLGGSELPDSEIYPTLPMCKVAIYAADDAADDFNYDVPIEGIIEQKTIVIQRDGLYRLQEQNTTKLKQVKEERAQGDSCIEGPGLVNDRPLTGSDLRAVMIETVDISDWITLGIQLDLHVPHLNQIEKDYTSVRERQKHVLQNWLDTGNASWAALVDALKSPLVPMEGLANRIELKKCTSRPERTTKQLEHKRKHKSEETKQDLCDEKEMDLQTPPAKKIHDSHTKNQEASASSRPKKQGEEISHSDEDGTKDYKISGKRKIRHEDDNEIEEKAVKSKKRK